LVFGIQQWPPTGSCHQVLASQDPDLYPATEVGTLVPKPTEPVDIIEFAFGPEF